MPQYVLNMKFYGPHDGSNPLSLTGTNPLAFAYDIQQAETAPTVIYTWLYFKAWLCKDRLQAATINVQMWQGLM
jgi:hypothetical protein